jgi:hypothetical protein
MAKLCVPRPKSCSLTEARRETENAVKFSTSFKCAKPHTVSHESHIFWLTCICGFFRRTTETRAGESTITAGSRRIQSDGRTTCRLCPDDTKYSLPWQPVQPGPSILTKPSQRTVFGPNIIGLAICLCQYSSERIHEVAGELAKWTTLSFIDSQARHER